MSLFISNTSFIISTSGYAEALEYIRKVLVPAITPEGAVARLLRVAELPGGIAPGEECQNIAVQIGFSSLSELHKWADTRLSDAIAHFTRKFGAEEVVFSTVLENVPL